MHLGVGPLLVPRFAVDAGVCETGTDEGNVCAIPGPPDCSDGANCVDYRVVAQDPVPLEGLAGTDDVFALAPTEAITGRDLNGDGDSFDSVVTLLDRETGTTIATGAGCPASGCPEGRAVARTVDQPFSFPAIAAEGEVVAFLEPEAQQLATDANGNAQVFESLLRVFRSTGGSATHLTAGLDRAVDAALLLNGRSLAVSNGLVFFRTPESATAARETTRVSLDLAGGEPNDASPFSRSFALSADGRFVAFDSYATDLVAGDANTFCSCTPAPSGGGCISGSSDCPDVFVRDRCVSNGAPVPGCTPGTEFASLAHDGSQPNLDSGGAAMSADGRSVAFSSRATNMVVTPAPSSPSVTK